MAPTSVPTSYVPNELLSRLVGACLYAMTFVLNDYLQLSFESDPNVSNPCLSVYVWPSVERAGRSWREPDPGYADAVRCLAPGIVQHTSERTGDGIRIGLDTGLIRINPAVAEVIVEIAVLDGFHDYVRMWRIGEDSFEHLG